MIFPVFPRYRPLLATTALGAMLSALPAEAADFSDTAVATDTVDAAAADAEEGAAGAIVVTGVRRRNEDVQTIPVAISVLDAKTIENGGIAFLGDVQQLVPSLRA